jgi:hypothetical protein
MLFNGMKVVIAGSHPRMTLSEKVPVTPEFRAEINAWIAGFFGYKSVIEDGQVIVDRINNTIYCNEHQYQTLRSALKEQP